MEIPTFCIVFTHSGTSFLVMCDHLCNSCDMISLKQKTAKKRETVIDIVTARSRMVTLKGSNDVSHDRSAAITVVVDRPMKNATSQVSKNPARKNGSQRSQRRYLNVTIRLRKEVQDCINSEVCMAGESCRHRG
mmetsp:Transcript_302/g.468  ORF Transcript_302/g.468 Transcript_302/m.468 type:complete len:134 (-) Transcript_302:688-1089(-)